MQWEEADFNGTDQAKAKYLHEEDYLGIGKTEEELAEWNNKIPESSGPIKQLKGSSSWSTFLERRKVDKTKMFGVKGAYEALRGDNTEELRWRDVFPINMKQMEEHFYQPERFQMAPHKPSALEKIKQATIFQMMLSIIKKQHTAEGMETIIKMAEYENSESEANTGKQV